MSIRDEIKSGTYLSKTSNKRHSIRDQIKNGTYFQQQQEQLKFQKAKQSILNVKNNRDTAFQNAFKKQENKDILPRITSPITNNITDSNAKAILPKVVTDEKLIKNFEPSDGKSAELFPTIISGINYLGQGIMKGAEGVFVDTPLLLAAGTKKLLGDEKGANALMEASNVSLTDMLINKASGNETNPYKNNNQNLFNQELDKNSMIKENNLAGKIVQGVGEMLPTIAIGGSLRGGRKARQIGSNILLGSKAFSGSTNEAYQESGDIGKSMLYGLGSAGTELLTEKISDGIPGLKSIDGTTKKEIIKNYLKSSVGEGIEEVASSLANPVLQTIYKGKESLKQYEDKDYWKEVAESGIVGTATGAILDSPNTINSLKNSKNSLNNKIQSQKQIAPLPKLNKDNVNVIKEDVANKQNINYNTNEGDTNGRLSSIIRGNDGGRIGSRVSTQKMEYGANSENVSQRRINRPEFEQQARASTKTNLTSNEQQTINNIKRQYGKDVVFFDKKSLKQNSNQPILLKESRQIAPVSLDNQINNAINNKTSNSKNYLGKVTNFVANKIQQLTGIDVSNRKHVLTDNDIRHMLNQHGNQNIEIEKGQIAITTNDIKNIPEIISNPTNIVKGTDNKLGQTIRYIKEYSDNNTYVVEVVPDKSNSLIIKTMWKKPSTLANSSITTPSSTSKTQGSDISTTLNNDNITNFNENVKLPSVNNIQQNEVNIPTYKDTQKMMNPNEISQLTPQDANTTPVLPIVKRNNNLADSRSSFYENATKTSQFLSEDSRSILSGENDIQYYKSITNEESLKQAKQKLDEGGSSETLKWFQQDSKKATATDIAEGWILMKQYQDIQDYDSMVEVAKKMREIGTNAGQTVQAFNIMERLTPEGMVKYAQSELSEAFERMSKNKTKEWIDKHRAEFDLQPNEVQFIVDNMNEIQTMEDGYDKRVKLAEIQKLMTDKLPPMKGSGIKSWMRISMLFNPKTQVRNVVGNAVIAPVNYFGDMFSSYADKLIAKKTGVRTTGNMNVKAILKGFKEGAYEATNDYRKGINTKDMEGNRFEIGEGKSFNDKKLIGRNLNRVEGLLNYVMDAGDRMFSQSSFENSLQNQMILNNTTEITQDMIDIARTESLQRTWNDNNNYTKFVLDIRKMLNRVGTQNYGLGDVLIPFAKTPANLTKAIIDYSPVGLVTTLIEGNNLRKSLTNGQYTTKMQHKFVQDLGKATAGTMLYILGYALAKAGVISGESDDDKDVSNFMKNTLGISSYSIKIGNKTFSYDWAQPLAAPLSITANIVKREKENASLLDAITSSLDEGFNVILEQSFFESINNVFSDPGKVPEKIGQEVLNLPARAIPTFSKQIADMTDGTQRTSYEYGKPVETAINNIKVKIPGLNKTLAPMVDTMGREIQKYGGKNNIFNVFLNPANVNTENISESATEIYRLYKETGETNIMPRVAPYYINKKGEKITLDSKQRAEYQKTSGDIIEKSIQELLKNSNYKKMDDMKKAEVINDIVNYSYNIAQNDTLNLDISQTYQKAYEYSKIGSINDYYMFKNNIDNTSTETKKESITNYLIKSDLNDEQLSFLYGTYYSSEKTLNNILNSEIPMKEFIKFNSQKFEAQYDKNGKEIANSRKNAVIKYVNNLKLSIPQKAILIKMEYGSYNTYDKQVIEYVNSKKLDILEKGSILKSVGINSSDKQLINYVNSLSLTIEEKTKILKNMGFTVRNGKVIA